MRSVVCRAAARTTSSISTAATFPSPFQPSHIPPVRRHPLGSFSSSALDQTDNKMLYWLLKSEPDPHILKWADGTPYDAAQSLQMVRAGGEGGAVYTGVRNFQARNNLLKMNAGDACVFYHSSCKVPGAAGVVTVLGKAVPDPDAEKAGHPFFDEKHTGASPRWYSVPIGFTSEFPRFMSLTDLRADPALAASDIVLFRQGRLSVQPLTKEQFDRIVELGSSSGSSSGSGSSSSSSEAAVKGKGKGKRQKEKGEETGEGEGEAKKAKAK
jgi:predicted RNA-binding protein with PUA-like domain